jgi:hypothetical protein
MLATHYKETSLLFNYCTSFAIHWDGAKRLLGYCCLWAHTDPYPTAYKIIISYMYYGCDKTAFQIYLHESEYLFMKYLKYMYRFGHNINKYSFVVCSNYNFIDCFNYAYKNDIFDILRHDIYITNNTQIKLLVLQHRTNHHNTKISCLYLGRRWHEIKHPTITSYSSNNECQIVDH